MTFPELLALFAAAFIGYSIMKAASSFINGRW
jgi:hypothetical protein